MKDVIVFLNRLDMFSPLRLLLEQGTGKRLFPFSSGKALVKSINDRSIGIGDISLLVLTCLAEARDPALYEEIMKFIRQFKGHSRLRDVPALLICREDESLLAACDDLGICHITLPVTKSALLAKVGSLCGTGCSLGEGSEPPVQAITIARKTSEMGSEHLVSPITIGLGPSKTVSEQNDSGPWQHDYKQKDKITQKTAVKLGSEPVKKTAPVGISAARAESERRLATVMFADISGFTAMSEKMDPEEVTRVMNGVFHRMEAVIKEHGGTIDKFIGDCVMVLFGVPRALENAPLMAVNTAIEMRNALYRYNRDNNLAIPLDIHIGMNTGQVVSGHVGGADKKDYTVMGDAVNLASRIEGASEKGQILVGPDTYRATQGDIDYRALAPVSLKGKSEPVPVYEVLSVREKAGRRTMGSEPRERTGPERMVYSELVGRDREMNELRHLVTGLIKGRGGIANVIGEAGIGKSRLMAEMKSDPAMKQVILLEGQAISMGRNLSFHPIIDLLKHWAGISEEDNEQMSFAKLDRAIRGVHPDEADEILPFVATLMGMKLSGKYADRLKGIEGEALEKLIFKNIRELLIKGSELRPMILRIEDLHWADTSSIELISSLFRLAQTHRILFLNFFRPGYEETGDWIVKTVKEEFSDISTEIALHPLDENESSTLISNLLNIKGLPQSLKDQITGRAGGNPFFIEEVVRSLIDEGAVVKKGDSFSVTEKINTVTVPLTINEVLMSRIDRLDEETKNLIKTASVIGRYFFYKIIAQVAENVSDIEKRLGYLEDIQLIRERKRMDELEYLFKHALAQEAAYESLLIQKRKDLHLQVAQSIEKVFSGRLHEFYGMLAYHYSKGEDFDHAEEYMVKAGEEAMKASASSEALEYFIKSLDLYRDIYGDRADPVQISQLEKNIATAYFNHGDYVEAVEYFTRVLEYNGEIFPEHKLLSIIKAFGGFCHLLIGLYIPFLKWKKKPDDADVELYSLYEKRLITLAHPDPQRFFIEFLYILKKYTKIDIAQSDIFIRVFLSAGALFSWPSISYHLSNKVLKLSREKIRVDNGLNNAILILMTAIHEFMVGNWMLENYHEEMEKLFLDKGDNWRIETYCIFLGFWYLEMGDVSMATRMVNKLKDIGENYEHKSTKALKSILEMRLLMKIRKFQEMLNEFKESIVFFDKIGERILNFEAYTFKARVLLLSGEVAGARECLEYLEKLYYEMDLIPFYKSDFRIARFMFDIHQFEDATNAGDKVRTKDCRKKTKQSSNHALKISRKFKRDRTEALKLTGTYWWLCGQPKKAMKWWKKSIDLGEMLGAKLELSRTYFEVGKRILTHEGSTLNRPLRDRVNKVIGLTPEECLAKAESMFREMDLQWDLAELEKLSPRPPEGA